MFGGLETILWFLVALIILVTIHEFGHFYVARRCGVRVLRFSIGFGKPLWSWHDKSGTEYTIAPIPLGGYVKMLDEREGEVKPEDLPFAFTRKSVWQRIAIVAAGPVANFILAVLLFWALLIPGTADFVPIVGEVEEGSIADAAGLTQGQEIVAVDGQPTPTRQALSRQLIDRLGETGTMRFAVKYPDSHLVYTSSAQIEGWLKGTEEPDVFAGIGLDLQAPPVVVGELLDGSPAAAAGFAAGDRILAANDTPVEDWTQWVEFVSARPGETLDILVERDGRELTLQVTPDAEQGPEGEAVGKIGMAGQWPEEYIRRYEYSLPGAFAKAAHQTWDTSVFILDSVKKLILGEISTKNLSGPITIAKVAGSSADAGWMSFVSFLALLSVSLGVFNLLPIPVLDGGHLAYYLVEVVKGSPVSERAQMLGYQVGLLVVVSIMILALYNDVMRL
ncbi:RIP metalloprotease RseP [Gilvimarinus sp. F26214L]|uniref:RIP metalloprotease RseP n=1 Tax=Gilvimarinus sp. DZF01 TaxID=3461371 RepID=UPI0040456D6A